METYPSAAISGLTADATPRTIVASTAREHQETTCRAIRAFTISIS